MPKCLGASYVSDVALTAIRLGSLEGCNQANNTRDVANMHKNTMKSALLVIEQLATIKHHVYNWIEIMLTTSEYANFEASTWSL